MYQPITLLNIMGKLHERLLKSRLQQTADRLQPPFQHDFIRNRGTGTQNLRIGKFITDALEEKKSRITRAVAKPTGASESPTATRNRYHTESPKALSWAWSFSTCTCTTFETSGTASADSSSSRFSMFTHKRNYYRTIRIRDEEIEYKNNIKYLGVHLDKTMTMCKQTGYVVQKARRVRDAPAPVIEWHFKIDLTVKLVVVQACLFPILDYGVVQLLRYSKSNLLKIEWLSKPLDNSQNA
ncbi:hypothetical protein EVAR_83772_1 [Eumeta japonica]|uniref:Uncharacterized protein n=1 Tax=Eumeta variegata TaxID=151549 RepID=A0A4C1WFF9_EUMVA|nr:hypothetical protein EVAR_83772_1 [Eumeta japonica]